MIWAQEDVVELACLRIPQREVVLEELQLAREGWWQGAEEVADVVPPPRREPGLSLRRHAGAPGVRSR